MNKKEIRPFVMEYTEAKNKIVVAVNEAMRVHKIPCFLLESILSDILHQVESGAKAEKEDAATKYEQQLAATKEKPLDGEENDTSSKERDKK